MGTTSTKFRLFVHKISFIINVTFPPLFLTLYAGRTKLLAEVLTMQAAFQLLVNCKITSLECIFQGAKKKGNKPILASAPIFKMAACE
jgi:hypothetical protein